MIDNENQIEYSQEGLVRAVQFGELAFVETAIDKHGLSANTRDADGCSVLQWAAINNRIGIAKFLVSKGADVNATGGNNDENALQWAVRCPSGTEMLSFFIDERVSLSHKSIYGCDALMIAAQCGQLNAALLLLCAGADVNTVDNAGNTPLYWLLRQSAGNSSIERLNLQRLLLRFKASVSHRANDGNNALHLLAESGKDFDIGTAFTLCMSDSDAAQARNSVNLTPIQVATAEKNSVITRLISDVNQYKSYPYYFPALVAALCYISIFLCVEWFGWIYGGLLIIAVIYCGEKFIQPMIHSGSSRISFGMASGIIITAFGYFYLVLAFHFSVIVHLIVLFYALIIPYSLFRTATTTPQYLYCESPEECKLLVERIVEQERGGVDVRFCPTCLVDRAKVSIHCSQCNRCMVSLDHHCQFVCNCVGRGNRRMFVLFLLVASTGCMAFGLLSAYAQFYVYCPDASGPLGVAVAVQLCMIYADPILVLVTWWTSLVGLWIFFILFSQIELIARETTTYEVQKRKNVGVDPCTSRALSSLWLFFTTGMYSISYPSTGASPGAGHSHQCTSGKCSHTAAGGGARHMDHYSYSALSKHEV